MTDQPAAELCVICRARRTDDAERAVVRSNVRRFAHEKFAVWRCRQCGSIHAAEQVDVAAYYRAYPMHSVDLDWRARAVYRVQLRRLVRAGFRREHSLLDYGCGSGAFVEFLRKAGYPHCVGYDSYNPAFAEERVLEKSYDCVLSQDVLEHVEDPRSLFAVLRRLLAPDGLLAIGTPNASAIDLSRPEAFLHTLHQPYHRHILSKAALVGLGADSALSRLRYYPHSYINTALPFINHRFLIHYLRCQDNTFDAAFEPVRPSLRLLSPFGILWGLLGSLIAPKTDGMALYRATPNDNQSPRQ
jgi:2-polyprenyl-3-methyl-5-hydroxy-6-metoxy-1,4-benzoquinol methylase